MGFIQYYSFLTPRSRQRADSPTPYKGSTTRRTLSSCPPAGAAQSFTDYKNLMGIEMILSHQLNKILYYKISENFCKS